MQLKDDNKKTAFDIKAVEKLLIEENKFITELFSKVAFPERYDEVEEEESDAEGNQMEFEDEADGTQKPPIVGEKKSRATTYSELRKRYDDLQSKSKSGDFVEKLKKKALKTRMKKTQQKEKRAQQKKLIKVQKLTKVDIESQGTDVKAAKPIYNSEGNIVFSKFDFSGIGKQKREKKEKDPKKILQNLQKQKERLEKLEAQGETEKVIELKENNAWKNALAKSQGEKVKDDPELLKKTVKRKEQQVKSSKKKWDKRMEVVKKAQEDKQKKRTENIQKRKKEKKNNKLKKAAKKGRIIPGF